MAKSMHDSWVDIVASERMPFPSAAHPNWKTYTNGKMGITDGKSTVFPDLVVLDDKNSVVMIGEVETESSVSLAETVQWDEYSGMVNTFYLYVPEGTEAEAKRLAATTHISGIRAYSVAGDRSPRIRNV